MLGAIQIKDALQSNDLNRIANTYFEVFGTHIDRSCGDCFTDAKKRLRVKLNEIDRDKSPIHIYIGVYRDANQTRNAELQECLWQNQNNPFVNKVIEVKERPTYQDLFNLFSEDAINIIVNSDIFFDKTLGLVKGIKPNQCYALSRWDWNGNGTAKMHNRIDSQDAWVFRGKVKKPMFADFYLGIPGCDNRIAYEIKKAGYLVLNPSKSIHALHYHSSAIRHYNSKTTAVPEPYAYVAPCALS